MQITIEALDRYGNPMKFDVNGLSAATYQHEFDHLQGRLFVDRVMDSTSFMTWSQFERVHRRRFEHRARELVSQYGQ